MTARAGGRMAAGRVTSGSPATHRHPVRPSAATPPSGQAGAAVPRAGGRTQQGARQQARAGGRTQQGTQAGQAVEPQAAAGQPGPGPDLAGGDSGDAIAGLVVAFFLYPMAVALITGGPARLRRWIAAKGWNQVSPHPGHAPGSSAGGTVIFA